MTTVGIELKAACGQCGENVPVNAVVSVLYCPKCQSQVSLDAATWRQVLEGPALDGPLAEPGKVNASVVPGASALMRSFVRRDAACARCGCTVPDEDVLAHAGRGWCVCGGCGESISVRELPASFAKLGGITHLIAEDASQLAARGPSELQPLAMGQVTAPCGKCGASLPVSAMSPRAMLCKYCGGTSVLSDDVWLRLHPVASQRAFFIRKEATTAGPTTDAWFAWSDLDDVVMGRDGNLYCLGQVESRDRRREATSVWCMDPYFKRLWLREGLPRKTDDGHLALTSDGHILVWEERRHSVLKLSARDGSTVATLGGKEPPGAQAHHLDLEHCKELVVHLHDTMLGFLHDKILRWAPDGTPVQTWAPGGGLLERGQRFGPLFRLEENGDRRAIDADDAPYVENVGHRPTELHSSSLKVTVGWDFAIYIYRSHHLLKLHPDGTRAWRIELPRGSDYGRPGVDAWGNVYVMRGIRDGVNGIYRVSPDGSDARVLVDGGVSGTPVGDERHLVVHPQGAVFLLSYGGAARVFAADGSARFASAKSRKDDDRRERKRAEDDE